MLSLEQPSNEQLAFERQTLLLSVTQSALHITVETCLNKIKASPYILFDMSKAIRQQKNELKSFLH